MNLRQKTYLKFLQKTKNWTSEHKIPGGRRKLDKTVYIIRRSGKRLGLFSYVETNLARIEYANKNNMIPVIDMKNYDNSLKVDESDNPWERFFEQPGGIDVGTAYDAKDIVISDSMVPEEYPDDSMEFLTGRNGKRKYWREITKKYLVLNADTRKFIDDRYKKLINVDEKTLGVLARGTDYAALKPSKHPIQPTGEEILEKVWEVFHEKEYDKVFLATEDRNIAKMFQQRFGKKYIANDTEYIEYQGGYLGDEANRERMQAIDKNRDYLTNIVILSRLNGIVAGRTSGTVGAVLMADSWEDEYFFDLGIYE